MDSFTEDSSAKQLEFSYYTDLGSDGKESACNARDPGLIPGSQRCPGKGHGNSLQYCCLGNSMDRGASKATVLGVTKSLTRLAGYSPWGHKESDTTEQLTYKLLQNYSPVTLQDVGVCTVTRSCLTLCNSLDCSPPDSSVHHIFQPRILDCVAISSSRGSSQSRDQTHISCIGRWILYHRATWESSRLSTWK